MTIGKPTGAETAAIVIMPSVWVGIDAYHKTGALWVAVCTGGPVLILLTWLALRCHDGGRKA